MSDLYSEQLVKKRTTSLDIVMKAVLVAVTILSVVLALLIPLLIIVPILLIVLDVFLFRRMDLEYEYLFVNGELDIDKIMGRAKRKNQLSVNMDNVEMVAPRGSKELYAFENKRLRVLNFTSGNPDAQVYEMILNYDNQQLRVLMEPGEAILEGMYLAAPRR